MRARPLISDTNRRMSGRTRTTNLIAYESE